MYLRWEIKKPYRESYSPVDSQNKLMVQLSFCFVLCLVFLNFFSFCFLLVKDH